MKQKVLSVGQCNPDHNAIKNFLEREFECEITKIDSTDEAIYALSREKYDLVLVNRKLDIDYTDGTILISEMQKSPELSKIPIMLISNYTEFQQEAIKFGAKEGFGKSDLGTPKAIQRVSAFLKQRIST